MMLHEFIKGRDIEGASQRVLGELYTTLNERCRLAEIDRFAYPSSTHPSGERQRGPDELYARCPNRKGSQANTAALVGSQ
jgi:hypothetical protein